MLHRRPHGQRVHQRRLAHRLAAGHGLDVVVVGEELHVEHRGHVGGRGDLVGRRRAGEQTAPGVVDEALGRHPAHALDEAAHDLPHVDTRIDRPADVDEQIDPRHREFAREPVDPHLRHRGALRVVKKRIAAAGLAVVVDAGRGVEAAGAEVDAVAAGRRAGCGEVEPLVGRPAVEDRPVGEDDVLGRLREAEIGRGELPRSPGGEPSADGPAGLDGGRTVQVGARRGGGGRGVGVFLGGRRHHHDPRDRQREGVGHELADFRVEPLPHLRAARRNLHRAVGVDVHQRVALVQKPRRERDAELHGHEGEPPQPERIGAVGRLDRRQPGGVVAPREQRVDDLGQVVAGHDLPVGRHVAVGRAVEIAAADLRGRDGPPAAAEKDRDLLHHGLDGRHALRATEAAEGRGRGVVGEADAATDVDMLEMVGVVGMEHRPLHHRGREIGGGPAVGVKPHDIGADPALVVEAHLPGGVVGVPLAGAPHVVVAAVDDAGRPAGASGDERRHDRRERALGFLAAEAPSHPLADADDLVHADAECLGDDVLRLRRALRRGVDHHLAVLTGDGERRLRLEIQVLLPEIAKHPGEPVRRGGERSLGVAAVDPALGADEPATLDRPFDREDGLGSLALTLDVDANEPPGDGEGLRAFGGEDHDRLPHVEHLAVGEDRLVLEERPEAAGGGQLGRRDHGHDAGHGRRRDGVDPADPAGRRRTRHEADDELVLPPRQVVDVVGRAGDVPDRRVVGDRAAHDGARRRVGGGAEHEGL